MLAARAKVCLLGASFGTENLGVNVLTIGAVRCIRHAYPGAEVFLMDYGREPLTYDLNCGAERLRVPLLNIRFSKKLWQKNHIAYLLAAAAIARLIPFRSIRERFLARNRCLAALCECTLVTAMSGGDSFSDIYGLSRFFYVALPQILALLLGKDLVLLPQTLGSFKGVTARAVARRILARTRTIFSRDLAGFEQVRALLGPAVDARLKFGYDVGFLLEPAAPANWNGMLTGRTGPAQPLVGLNVSGLLLQGGYNHGNMFGLREDYGRLTEAMIRTLIGELGAVVILVPHVYGTAEGSESDFLACRKVLAQFAAEFGERIRMAPNRLDESETKFVIGQCDVFAGARMHSCIAAISQCVPAVSIAYSAKFAGVMKTVGAEDLVADARKLNEGEILEILRNTIRNRAAIRARLEQTVPAARQQALEMLNVFAEDAPSHVLNSTTVPV